MSTEASCAYCGRPNTWSPDCPCAQRPSQSVFPNKSRAERICEMRRGQPLDELWRKAELAARRGGKWTQELEDWAAVKGQHIWNLMNPPLPHE